MIVKHGFLFQGRDIQSVTLLEVLRKMCLDLRNEMGNLGYYIKRYLVTFKLTDICQCQRWHLHHGEKFESHLILLRDCNHGGYAELDM